jgi:NitT/TauT family transport system permease protein
MTLSASPLAKRGLPPSIFWSLRQGFPPRLGLVLSATALVVPLIFWSVASYGGWVTSVYLPTPTSVISSGIQMFAEEDFTADILASTFRVAVGFFFAGLVGIPVGILMGTFYSMDSLFSPIVGTVRYMPIVAFVPLVVIWAGIGEEAKILIIFLGSVLYNALMVADAVKFIPDEMLNVAYTLGLNRRQVLFRVIVPAVFPSILDTLRVNIAGAWNFLVVAELVSAQSGLGYRISQSQRFLQTDKVLFCILVIGVVGLLIDFGLKTISQVFTPWADQARQ